MIGSVITAEDRTYHRVPLERMGRTKWTHVETCGPVVYVRRQGDGDWHVTLAKGETKVVLEIIPLIPLPVPKKGQIIVARGIRRVDDSHGWPEIHPVESWETTEACR